MVPLISEAEAVRAILETPEKLLPPAGLVMATTGEFVVWEPAGTVLAD